MSNISNVNAKKSGSEFLAKIKYGNTLPSIPIDAKLIPFPFEPSRYISYTLTQLEKNRDADLPINWRSKMEIDLVDMSQYPSTTKSTIFNDNNYSSDFLLKKKEHISTDDERVDPNIETLASLPIIVPKDSNLKPEIVTGLNSSIFLDKDAKASDTIGTTTPRYRPNASWLRKSEHGSLASELAKNKSRNRESLKRTELTSQPMTLEKALSIIEKSFDLAEKENEKTSRYHPLYPSLTVKKVVPLLPDMVRWNDRYTLCVFDGPPHSYTDRVKNPVTGKEEQVKGILHGYRVGNERSDIEFSYFASSSKNKMHQPQLITRRVKDEMGGEESETETETDHNSSQTPLLPYLRTYNFQIKSGEEMSQFHLLSFQEDQITYHPLINKMVLRAKRGNVSSADYRHRRPVAIRIEKKETSETSLTQEEMNDKEENDMEVHE